MTTQIAEAEIDNAVTEERPLAVRSPDVMSAPEQMRAAPLRAIEPRPQPQGGPRMSENTEEVFRALALARLEFGEVVKGRTAQIDSRTRGSYTYKFANLSDTMKAVDPALKKHGLVPTRIPAGNRVYVRLVHAPSGQWIEGVLPLVLPDHGADVQRMGSALTYTSRYILTMLLGIVAEDEEDDDGAAQTSGARGR